MSDQNKIIAELEEQITLLQNALKRERNAKYKLETKLEEKLQLNFEENQAFLQAYEDANSRQIQLQFLTSLTSDIFSITDINKMLARFLTNIAIFLEPCHAYILSKRAQKVQLHHLNLSQQAFEQVKTDSDLAPTYQQLNELATDNKWHRLSTKHQQLLQQLTQSSNHDTTLVYPLAMQQNNTNFLLLNLNHYCYGQDFKQTLNTATKQFTIATQRLLTDMELTNNYKKLKHTLAALKSTQHQLVHSEKMSSLGQLSAGIAHEINNPLGYITSNFEVLKDYCQLFEHTFIEVEKKQPLTNQSKLNFARQDTPDLLSSCIKGVNRISEIVSSLKTFSRKDKGQLQATSLNMVIEDALKIVWNQLKYQHKVKAELSPSLPLIHANEGQLQQVFINLFLNAAQAMAQNGQLTIKAHATEHQVVVSVKDTGCGMSQATKDKLFEPFFTTKQNKGGTGLGLSVSYAILERHQAEVEVNSELGAGTEFVLRFPTPEIL